MIIYFYIVVIIFCLIIMYYSFSILYIWNDFINRFVDDIHDIAYKYFKIDKSTTRHLMDKNYYIVLLMFISQLILLVFFIIKLLIALKLI